MKTFLLRHRQQAALLDTGSIGPARSITARRPARLISRAFVPKNHCRPSAGRSRIVLQRIRICLHRSPSTWFVVACNLERVHALVASLNEGLLSGKDGTSLS